MSEPIEGVRFGKPDADRIAWCSRVGVPVPFSILYLDVTIRRVSDGAERLVVDTTGFCVDHEGDEEEALMAARYQFTMGNYGCDCNRALMFARAGNEEDPDIECGHKRFQISAPEWLVGVP